MKEELEVKSPPSAEDMNDGLLVPAADEARAQSRKFLRINLANAIHQAINAGHAHITFQLEPTSSEDVAEIAKDLEAQGYRCKRERVSSQKNGFKAVPTLDVRWGEE